MIGDKKSAGWLEKQNKLSKNEKLTPKEGQYVHELNEEDIPTI